jgi:hypothetical protein
MVDNLDDMGTIQTGKVGHFLLVVLEIGRREHLDDEWNA